MPQRPLVDGERTVGVRVRWNATLHAQVVAAADEMGTTIAAVDRMALRAWLRARNTAQSPVQAVPKPRRRRTARVVKVMPDPVAHTLGFLDALRTPHVARHDWIQQADGPARCSSCGATTNEDEAACR